MNVVPNRNTARAQDGRHTIAGLENAGSGVSVGWGDGHRSLYPAIWLRHNCTCEICGSTETGRRHLRLTDIPADIAVANVAVSPNGELVVVWKGDDHRSLYQPLWLRAHCLSDEERARRRHKPTLWHALSNDALCYFSFPELREKPEHLRFLERVRDFGFAILTDVTCEREATEKVAKLVGTLRATNYGIYELISQPRPQLAGDTALALAPHTDEPYRHNPPGITFFHVLAQSEEGGDSTLVDGYYVAEMLRQKEPDAFALLSTVPASFHRTLKEGRAFVAAGPVIRLDQDGHVEGVRILDRGTAPFDLPPEKVRPYYDALRILLQYLYEARNHLTVKIKAGEMLVFNNQRLLHGRTAFDATKSHRHVRSCNVDLDEFYSSLRVAYRELGREEAYMWLAQGAGV
jgi:gamma-butyrobetaine dioxygenase/trimethyllysine dioxygenase